MSIFVLPDIAEPYLTEIYGGAGPQPLSRARRRKAFEFANFEG